MSIHNTIFLVVLLVPLSIDTFVLSAALGIAGMPKREQLRTSLILAGFEAGMPIIGALIGHGVGGVLGSFTGYIAGAVIGIAGILMLKPGTEEQEEKRLNLLSKTKGWSVIYLGLAISVDGLAIGLSLGLIHVSLIMVVCFMAILAFAASRIGLSIGTRLGDRLRDRAEKFAGIILVIVALIMLVLKASGRQL